MSSLDMLFKNPILILFYFITLICISWQLTLFTILFVPPFGWFMGVVGKKLKAHSIEAQALLQKEDHNFVLGKTMKNGKLMITLTRAEKNNVTIASAPIKGGISRFARIRGFVDRSDIHRLSILERVCQRVGMVWYTW